MSGITDRLQAMADQAAQRNGVDPGLFRALIQSESSWNPKAISSAGAQGLGQLMPATAQALGVRQPLDAQQNLDGAARYLRSLLERYQGDEQKALGFYNGGNRGVTNPLPETKNYISKVLSLRDQAGGNPSPPAGAVSSSDYALSAGSIGRALGWGSAPAGQNQASAPAAGIADLQSRTRANLAGLNPDLQSAIAGAAGDLKAQGVDLGGLITSGYRSTDQQARLYANRANNPNPVAPPGHSLHESGAAVDIAINRLEPDQQQAVLSTLARHGLTRPLPSDPVHFQLGGATPAEGTGRTAPSGDYSLSADSVGRALGWSAAPAAPAQGTPAPAAPPQDYSLSTDTIGRALGWR